MKCPYADCPQIIPLTKPNRLQGCPSCKRPIKICRQIANGKACLSINQPLAQFCRTCGSKFPPLSENILIAPSQNQSASNSTGPTVALPSNKLSSSSLPRLSEFDIDVQKWNLVTCLDDETLEPNSTDFPIEMGHFGGMILLAYPEGRFCLVEPFRTPPQIHRYYSKSAKNGPKVPRITTSGPWGVLFTKYSLSVLNLLSIRPDCPKTLDDPAYLNWECPPGQKLVGTPLLFECPRPDLKKFESNGTGQNLGKPYDSALVWLTINEQAQPVLWWVYLSQFDNLPPPIKYEVLPYSMPDERLALLNLTVNKPESHPQLLVLGTQQGVLVTIAPWGGGKPIKFLWKPGIPLGIRRAEVGGLSGVCFLPNNIRQNDPNERQSVSKDSTVLGTLAVASIESRARQLNLIRIFKRANSLESNLVPIEKGGTPISVVKQSGGTRILAIDGNDLITVDQLQYRQRITQESELNSTTRVNVSGSLVLLSGASVTGRWHLLVDLEKSRVLSRREEQNLLPQPVRIGAHLFGLEWIPVGMGPSQLHLIRWDLASENQSPSDLNVTEVG